MTRHASSTAAVLRDARRLIERGWVQGDGVVLDDSGETRYCIMGAITEAVRRLDCAGPRGPAGERARAALLRVIDDRGLADFNDAEGRTQAEVLAVFDRAMA